MSDQSTATFPSIKFDGPGREALDVLYHFVSALELSPTIAVHSIDRSGRVCYWNTTCAATFGVPAHEAIGKPLRSIVTHPGHETEFQATLDAIWQSGQPAAPRDWLVRDALGQERWMYASHFPVLRDGQPQQIFCMEVDIGRRKLDDKALREAGAKFRYLFDRSTDAIVLLEGGIIVEANPAALAMFRSGIDEFKGRTLLDFSPPQQPSGESSFLADAAFAAQTFIEGNRRFEWQYRLRDGATFWAEVLLTSVSLDHEFLSYAVVRDISERKAAESSLMMAAQVFEQSRDGVVFTDPQHRVIAVSRAYTAVSGYTTAEVLGAPLPDLHAGIHDADFYEHLWACVDANDHWEGEVWNSRKSGEQYPVWVAITAIRSASGGIANFMVILSDITDRKRNEERARYLAEHDFLTDLPNRFRFLDRLTQALATASRTRTKVAVMFLDLDRFKGINDRFGHQVGDAVLKEVAGRLTGCVREVDTVSRQGGDEFVVILADIGGIDQAAHVAANVMQAVSRPVDAGGHRVSLSVSIGISISPDDGDDIDTLLQHADVAMYHAKQNGRNGFSFFDADMNTRVIERVRMENSLGHAIANGELELVYQPEIDIGSGLVVGVEALLRWRHPQHGLLEPQQFLEVAEKSGLIVGIGRWVLEQACRQARAWREQGHAVVVAVNLSQAQFEHEDLLASVDNALLVSGLAPHDLELEVTEGVIMAGAASTLATADALRARGVRLTIDDFGTGYSSLSSLRLLPLSKLKIDRSFVDGLLHEPSDASIIPAIIALARSLKLRVIAEGVETAAQLDYLQQHGCDEYQGHYASRAQSQPSFTGSTH